MTLPAHPLPGEAGTTPLVQYRPAIVGGKGASSMNSSRGRGEAAAALSASSASAHDNNVLRRCGHAIPLPLAPPLPPARRYIAPDSMLEVSMQPSCWCLLRAQNTEYVVRSIARCT